MQRPCRVYNMKTEALPLGRGGTERPDTLSSRLRRFPPTSFSATSYYIDKRGGAFALSDSWFAFGNSGREKTKYV